MIFISSIGWSSGRCQYLLDLFPGDLFFRAKGGVAAPESFVPKPAASARNCPSPGFYAWLLDFIWRRIFAFLGSIVIGEIVLYNSRRWRWNFFFSLCGKLHSYRYTNTHAQASMHTHITHRHTHNHTHANTHINFNLYVYRAFHYHCFPYIFKCYY